MENINIMEIIDNCKCDIYNGIKVINICNLFESIWPDYFKDFKLYHERERKFCELICPILGKKISYYSADKEDFSIRNAIIKAKNENLSIVIVENMS